MCKQGLDDHLKGLLVTSFKLYKLFQIGDSKIACLMVAVGWPKKRKKVFFCFFFFYKVLISPGGLVASLELVWTPKWILGHSVWRILSWGEIRSAYDFPEFFIKEEVVTSQLVNHDTLVSVWRRGIGLREINVRASELLIRSPVNIVTVLENTFITSVSVWVWAESTRVDEHPWGPWDTV